MDDQDALELSARATHLHLVEDNLGRVWDKLPFHAAWVGIVRP
jgi:hypothetical protein